MNNICHQLTILHKKITAAEQKYQRFKDSVHLLAVSKTQPITALQEAIDCGQLRFGENYLQEALPKINSLANSNLEWHFIGSIQSNKTRSIAENFAWVHGVDRLDIAERLNAQRPRNMPKLNICVQINSDDETSKAGIKLSELPLLIKQILPLKQLQLRGLMTIPAAHQQFEAQRQPFKLMRLALEKQNELGNELDTLSMGMSADYEAAIAEGATIIRIGTAIFGQRT